jgi:hypothetical protein
VWREGIEQRADALPGCLLRAPGGFAQQMLKLGGDLLDPVQIGAVEPAPAKAGRGTNRSLVPLVRIAVRTEGFFWLERLSRMTMSPGPNVEHGCSSIYWVKVAPLIG